jgi:small subunit ribosomal protein S16
MAVRIRLSRVGKKNAPFSRIVALDGRKKRDGAYLEDLGTYDNINSKLVHFHEERINYWISVGAQPSETVKRLHRQYKEAKAV